MPIGIGGTVLVVVLALASLTVFELLDLLLIAAATYVLIGYQPKHTLGGSGIKNATPGGVIVFRRFQWLIPIPVGYGLILYWQRRHRFNLLSAEKASYASDIGSQDGVST